MHITELHQASGPVPRAAANARTDACIIAASRRDPEAFEELFERYWPELHTFCCARTGAAGEDVAAETFRVAFDKRRRYDLAYRDARAWLYGIATRLIQHHFRHDRRQTAAIERSGRLLGHPEGAGAASDVERWLLGPEVAAAVDGLNGEERDALLLWAWADLSYGEIAQALDVPVGTVRSRLSRARQRVRDHLEERSQDDRE
jgi:RNA polymerase sigma factor (sigma-70 family)